MERVEKWTNGQVKIDYLGGPEVIKTFDQGDALRTGAIDMILYYPWAYLKPLMPSAQAEGLSMLTPWEERESGAFDLWTEIFAKQLNAKFVLKMHSQFPFWVWSNVKLEKIEDFKGLIIRVMPLYIPFQEALGAAPLTLPPPEVYTAMERGTVDAFMWPFGVSGFAWQEVTKYQIQPSVFQAEACCVMNMDVWNKIPKHLQDVIMDVGVDVEYIGTARVKWLVKKEWDEVLAPAGMTVIELPPDDAKKFIDTAYSATWEAIIKDAPEYGPRLKEVLSKK